MAVINHDHFVKHFFILNPFGSSVEAWNQLRYIVDNSELNNNGEVDYYYLYNKYKEYIDYWNTTFGQRDDKYISKSDKKKSIYDFLIENKYNESFEIILNFPARDPYLFGEFSLKVLLQKINVFKNILEKRKWKMGQENEKLK